MKRHSTDFFSLLSGLVFAALGVVFALDAVGTYHVDLSVIPAIVFIVFGLGMSASVLMSFRAPEPAPVLVEPAVGDESVSDPDTAPGP
jgi:hypothetical protein